MKFRDNIYVKPKSNLQGFRKVLNNYLELSEHYTKLMEGQDYVYVHTEMACVAHFASAVTNNGWAAVCEHGQYKIKSDDERENSWGRGDIYITDGNREFYGEAKFTRVWPAKKGWQQRIKDTVQLAEDDLDRSIKIRRGKNAPGIALTFLSFFQEEFNTALANTRMDQVWEFLEKVEYDAYAYSHAKKLAIEWKDEYPIGHIVLIKSFT